MDSINCPRCGLANTVTALNCRQCGVPLVNWHSPNSHSPNVPPPNMPPPNMPPPNMPPPNMPPPGTQAAVKAAGFPKWLVLLLVLFLGGGLLFFALLFIPTLKKLQDLQWQEYRSISGNYSIQMPGKVEEKSQTQMTAIGPLEAKIALSDLGNQGSCVVVYSKYPTDLPITKDIHKFLELSAEGISQASPLIATSKKEITLDSYPGMEVEVATNSPELPNAKGVYRIYWVAPQLYVIGIIAPTNKKLYQEREKYLNSFKILNAPKAPEVAPQADPQYQRLKKLEHDADILTRDARNQHDWETVERRWQEALELARAIPPTNPSYKEAQEKVTQYQQSVQTAQKNQPNAKKLPEAPNSTTNTKTNPTANNEVALTMPERLSERTYISYLTYNSRTSDPKSVVRKTFTPKDGNFSATIEKNYQDKAPISGGISIKFNGGGRDSCQLQICAPNRERIYPGNYKDAQRYSSQSPTKPGIYFSNGGCGDLTGRFVVYSISFTDKNELAAIDVEFEQSCYGQTTMGRIQYNIFDKR